MKSMKKSFILLTAAAVAMLVACNKQEVDNSKVTVLSATLEQQVDPNATKTSLDPSTKNVFWTSGDQITVIGSSATETMTLQSGEGTTTGSFGTTSVASPTYAVYPNSAYTSHDGANITISLPATQTYVANSFGNGANVAVATIDGEGNMAFKNTCGVLKLQLKGVYTVSRIELSGKNNEKLNGSFVVDASAETPTATVVTTATASEKTITLDCGEGVQLSPSTATTFFFVVPVGAFGTLGNGFEAKVYDVNGDAYYATLATTNTGNVINRSSIRVMPVCNASFLPDQYLDVDYIKGSNGAALKAGIKPADVHTIETCFSYSENPTENQSIWGIYGPDSNRYMLSITPSGTWELIYNDGSGPLTGFSVGTPPTKDDRHIVKTSLYNGFQEFCVDGVSRGSSTKPSSYSVDREIYFLARNDGNIAPTACFSEAKLYWAKVWATSDNLSRYLIPCLDSNDSNAIGLYDVVGGAFYKAVGAGTPVSGTSLTK